MQKPITLTVNKVKIPLDVVCEHCDGKATRHNPDALDWNRRYDEISADGMEWASVVGAIGNCPPEVADCDHCDNGMILTDAGAALIRLMRRYSDGV